MQACMTVSLAQKIAWNAIAIVIFILSAERHTTDDIDGGDDDVSTYILHAQWMNEWRRRSSLRTGAAQLRIKKNSLVLSDFPDFHGDATSFEYSTL